MVYECDKCEKPLGAGMLFCPYCGEKFPGPVPGAPASIITEPTPTLSPAQTSPQLRAPSFQAAPTMFVKKKTSFFVKALATAGGLFGLLLLIGIISGSNQQPNPTATTSPGIPSSAITPDLPISTPKQQHTDALKLHEENIQQERQVLDQEKEQRQEAKRQAEVQAEQDRQDAAEAKRGQVAEQEQQDTQNQDEDIKSEIKAKVQRDFPGDYFMQKSAYDLQLSAYQYMQTLPDDEIKGKVQQDFPGDYFMQKSAYELQMKSKQEMQ